MSVIAFTLPELVTIAQHGMHHICHAGNDPYFNLASTIQRSTIYYYSESRERAHLTKFKPDQTFDQEQLTREIWNRLIYYAHIANQVAYSVQYQDTPAIIHNFPETTEDQATLCTTAELYKKLRKLQYNLVTNGGNTFLPGLYHELLEKILNEIAEHLARSVTTTPRLT